VQQDSLLISARIAQCNLLSVNNYINDDPILHSCRDVAGFC